MLKFLYPRATLSSLNDKNQPKTASFPDKSPFDVAKITIYVSNVITSPVTVSYALKVELYTPYHGAVSMFMGTTQLSKFESSLLSLVLIEVVHQ